MSAPTIQPDPSAIGGIAKAPFALAPNMDRLFKERTRRLEGLAENSRLAPYLRFLAGITKAQHELVSQLPPLDPLPAEQVTRARENAMPPIDRSAIGSSPLFRETLKQFFAGIQTLDMPVAAAEALARVQAIDEETLLWMVDNIAVDNVPMERIAEHLFVAAAIQIHAARIAATLDATALVPIQVGVCPACGGKPVASMVIGFQGAEGARYAACSCCSTMWNEVRVKCLTCGSTKGVGYRAVETGTEEATIKAEVCDTCSSWVKILYQNKNPSLEVIADDVASLGLDLLMKDTDYKRAGFDPFLMGY
jgi:FdhE protein